MERNISSSYLYQPLEHQAEYLRSIVDRSPAVTFVWRAAEDWPVEHVSGNVSQFGYSAEDFLSGRVSWVGVTHQDDVPRLENELLQYRLQGINEFAQEYRLLTRWGDVRWIEDRTVAIMDENGDITHYQGTIFDVTERKHTEVALRHSEEKFRTLFETMPQGVVHMDSRGRVLSANVAAERIFGLQAAEWLGRTCRSCVSMWKAIDEAGYPLSVEHFPAVRALREGVEIRDKVVGIFNPADKKYRWIDMSAVPLFRNGKKKPYQVYAVFEDITEIIELRRGLEAALEKETYFCQVLQKALLPDLPPAIAGCAIADTFLPAFSGCDVGGDFYDVFRTERGDVGILIGDVSGKGFESASLAAAARSTIRAFAYDASCAGDVLTLANPVLCGLKGTLDMFVTAIFIHIDLESGEMHYSSAGHPPAVIQRADGSTETLSFGQPPIGVMERQRFSESRSRLSPGDRIVLYTDGISEARCGPDMFGTSGVEQVLKEYSSLSPPELRDRILSSALEWSSGRLSDDIAIMVIERTA